MTSLHLICPHCAAINRIPADRLSQNPNCGRCHQRLFNAQPLTLNAESLTRYLTRSSLPLLVDFWAPWCGPCRSMAPHFATAAAQLEPQLHLAKINTEEQPALSAHYQISSIPLMILFVDGHEKARHSGAMSSAQIVQWVQRSR